MKQLEKDSIFGEISDKSLVHKVRQENVFVTNLRRAIPVYLAGSEIKRLQSCLGEDDRELLESSYIKCKIQDRYIFRDCPECISISDIKEAFIKNNLDKSALRFLRNHYRKNGISGFYCLETEMDENETAFLRRTFSLKHYYLPDKEKVALSRTLIDNGVNSSEDVFYGSMVIDTNHFFFFEHRMDHVPGMMLIETLRQMLIAVCHKFGSVPLDYSFVLSKINFEFFNYIELYMPVLIRVKVLHLNKYSSGMWGEGEFEMNVYQNSNLCCSSYFKGSIMSHRAFQRIRKSQIKPNLEHLWFVLRDNLKYTFIVKSSQGKTRMEILYLSLDGCIVKYESSKYQTALGTFVDYFVYFDEIGLIQGKAECNTIKQEKDLILLHFKFCNLEIEDKNNLQQVVLQFGYLAENNIR